MTKTRTQSTASSAPIPSGDISVFAVPHPFAAERVQSAAAVGCSIADIVAGAQPDSFLRGHAHVWINGHYVPVENWARVRPKAGTVVTVRMAPMGGGGGGKNPLRTVLSLALMAASPMLAGSVTGALGLAGTGSFFGFNVGGIITSGVGLLGRLALNALAPPARPRFSSNKESATLFIQGARNQASPFGRVPRVLGRHRMVPPLGALPYTETAGNDQYLRMLFVWGYGPLEISDLKIGETPLADFTGVEIETRQGHGDDAPISLYSNSVIQNDLQVLLTQAGGYVTRTTDTAADEISVDITLPRGLFSFAASGAKGVATVSVTIGYSPKGAGTWTDQTFEWTAAQSAALRENARFIVTRGQYDVRVKRNTADDTTGNVFDETVWTALRTVRYAAPVRMPGVAMTALRIKASDQLSGVIERFNGVVQSVVPDWTGSAWEDRVTSNPAALFRHVLQGSANARPLADGRLDLGKIQAWHGHCAAAGREFNAVIDYDISVRGILQDIAAAGRASPALIDGKWAVVEDRTQTVPVQHFTPRNTWGFQGGKTFDDLPHALRVRFINRDKGWMQDERLVFDDGYDETNAVKYDTLELSGITSSDQAWKDGRYHIATARLRPETYSFMADLEHIVCTRGDLIRFTHDVPLFGLMSARVKSVTVSGGNITTVTLDARATMEAGKSYALRVRLSDGTSLLLSIAASAGTSTALTLVAPVAAAGGPVAGDLALFGESGQESAALVVKSVEPHGDLNAKITCVDAAPAVHAADSGSIPAWSPQITVPPEMQRPPAPVVAGMRSDSSGIVITLAAQNFALPLFPDARLRRTEETDFHPAQFTAAHGRVIITGIDSGAHYDISLVYRSAAGLSSAPTVIPNYAIEGAASLPASVQGFGVNVLGGTAHLGWDAVNGDIAGYRIKFNNAVTGASWANSFELVSRVSRTATSIAVPAQVGTWLIKAVDAAGRESADAASTVSPLDRIDGYANRATVDETPAFSGTMTGGSSDVAYTGDDRLVLDDALEGVYYFDQSLDLADVYPVLLSAQIDVMGINAANLIDGWGDVDLVQDWDGSEDPSTWNVQLQVRATNDDPAGSPAWSDWRNFTVGECTARAFQFRLKMSSSVAGITPSVSALSVSVDMHVWAQSDHGIESDGADDVDGAGTRVTFASAFYDSTALTVTPHDMATGDYYVIANRDETGFGIAFHDDADVRITRTFDWIAQGIGRKI